MTDIRFDHLGPEDYDRAKKVFDKAKHPGFIGRELFFRAATTGKACIAVLDELDAGVALVAKNKLLALSVVKAAQGRGVGPAIMAHLRPDWVNSIAERIGFFEKIGYISFGAPKVGANGKHATQLMQRKADAPIADAPIADAPAKPPEEERETPAFLELLTESPESRAIAELEILDGMMAKALMAEKFESALKIMDAAKQILRMHGKRS
jgi:GNAT superfamily N-acetyltransferase